jgi:prolyl-tRNA synthetase
VWEDGGGNLASYPMEVPIVRASQFLYHTLRQVPAEADDAGHALLLRGGYVRPVAAGLFSFTPLGLRVKHRIERILREEMDALGVQEVSLPFVQPAELWRESGRWDSVGDEMVRLRDRAGREVVPCDDPRGDRWTPVVGQVPLGG